MTVDEFPADAVFHAYPEPAGRARRKRLADVLDVPDVVPAGGALAVWAAELLFREAPRHEDGVWCLLAEPGFVAALSAADMSTNPALTLTAGRFVGLSGWGLAYDLAEAEPVASVPDGWLETRVFSLRTLYTLCSERGRDWTAQQQPSGETPTAPPPAS